MNNIQTLIRSGESEQIEFKQSFDKESIETVVALANTQGGIIFIGVKDDSSLCGVEIGSESLQNYANSIKSSTEPSLMVDIQLIPVDDKKIIVIQVDEFPIKPVSYKGKYFKRVANSNHQMNLTQISAMHMQSLQLSWDAYVANDVTFDELDKQKIKRFITKVNESERFTLKGTELENLQKLNLLKNEQPVNAAQLLFAKNQNIYNIHIGRFKTPSTILDDKMIRTTLFEAVEEIMLFILSHIKVAFEFTGELERTEILEYPKPALREIVLNAIVHRDYLSPVDTQIKIFDQSITFFNPGKLYGDLTIEQLKTDHYQSRTRNKLIAEAFYLTKDIEKYGSGYIRIRKAIQTYSTMAFDYEESGDGYLATLSYTEQKTTQETERFEKDGGVNGGVNLIYELIEKTPNLKAKQIADTLNVPLRTVERELKNLKDQDKIHFKGAPKTGGYYVK